MDSLSTFVWQPDARSARSFLVRSLAPIAGLCLLVAGLSLSSEKARIPALLAFALALPFLLHSAETWFARWQGRPIRFDRDGLTVGDLRLRWRDIVDVEVASRAGRPPLLRFRLVDPARDKVSRSLLLRAGLYPAESRGDFYLPAEYGLSADEMAAAIRSYLVLDPSATAA